MTKSRFSPSRVIGRKLLCMIAAFTLLRCLLLPPVWTDRRLDLPDVDKCDFTLMRASCFEQIETAVADPDAQALFYVLAQQARAGWNTPADPALIMMGGISYSVQIQTDTASYRLTLSGVYGTTSSTIRVQKISLSGESIWSRRVYHVPPELLARAVAAFEQLLPSDC